MILPVQRPNEPIDQGLLRQTLELDLNSPEAKRPVLQYIRLLRWAIQEWETRYPNVPYTPLWSNADPGSNLVSERIKPKTRVTHRGRFLGAQIISCPLVLPINDYRLIDEQVTLTERVGAFIFQFEYGTKPFDVLYVSSYFVDGDQEIVSVALVPTHSKRFPLQIWGHFVGMCRKAIMHVERLQKVYVIGGTEAVFEPTVLWENVILDEALKADIRTDMETFFRKGVGIYAQLGLPAFRKILLVGPPGTGKTTLCAAMAKLALENRCVVIYVSAADREGASFAKIHRALKVTAESKHPVLLIVEELDAYISKEDKSQILNVLDGMESPTNSRGALLLATTNYPEMIDERIAKRPGRVDRVIFIPPIQNEEQARRMLVRYMGPQWRDEHESIVPHLIGQTGVFVREVALYARMLAANEGHNSVSLHTLHQSVSRLLNQLNTGDNLQPRRPAGFGHSGFSQ